MRKLLSHIAAAGLGLWLATLFIPNVSLKLFPDTHVFAFTLTADWQLYILLGIVLGLLTFFVKPFIDLISLPLAIITLGMFRFLVAMGFIWALDTMFKEFSAPWFFALFWTTLLISILRKIITHLLVKED